MTSQCNCGRIPCCCGVGTGHSCICGRIPCCCCGTDPLKEYDPDSPVNPRPNECTLCTGDTKDNIFCVPRAPGYPPRCILDEMTWDQVYEVLRMVPKAKGDLMRITCDPALLTLARDTELVESPFDESEKVQKRLDANSLPMYTLFNGNFDGTPNGTPKKK